MHPSAAALAAAVFFYQGRLLGIVEDAKKGRSIFVRFDSRRSMIF